MWSEATMTRSSMAADDYPTSRTWYNRHRNSPHFKKKKTTSCASSRSMSREGQGRKSERETSGEETDKFLELLSKVQGAQYDNQRCSLPPPKPAQHLNNNANGDIPVATQGDFPTSSIPTGRQFRAPNGVIGRPAMLQAGQQSTAVPYRKSSSPSPSPSPTVNSTPSSTPSSTSTTLPVTEAGSTATPSRKSMDALREVVSKDGPHPLLINSPGGGFWIENGEYESARATSGFMRASEISTEHFRVETDPLMFAYMRNFLGKDHRNYVGRDSRAGGLILSILFEDDQVSRRASIRMLYRTQKESVHKLVPTTLLSEELEPEQYMKYMAQFTSDKDINPEGVTRIMYPKVYDLFQKFDEHTFVRGHKIGVVYQKYKQVSEEEMFSNVETSKAFEEFLELIGEKVKLKGFEGFRGGLDTASDQTGEYSYYTTYKDKEIMFHVSTLLPYNASDSQQVQRKRHIGNDIVVVVFQDKNTTFCPGVIRSHFIHSYIVVQVEYPNTDHTVYKVAVAAKNDVGQFDPQLPRPAVFEKGPEFREWLITKLLNAEISCHKSPDFQKLATRTRAQLFNQLVEEVTHYRDDIDGVKSFTLSDRHSGLSLSPSQQRRKTLGGIFGNRESLNFGITSKRKSIGGRLNVGGGGGGEGLSPKGFRPLRSEAPMVMIGSTPDLAVPSSSRLPEEGLEQTMNISSFEDHRVEEQISAVDTPSTSESISKKVKRRFTFKRDKKKSKSPQETIEESSSEQHSREFRDAFNSSPSPYKMDGQNSENSSLASSSAMHLSIPSDLHHLNRSNPGSAENVSQCGTNAGGKSELRGSVSAEFESQEVRMPFQVGGEEEEQAWSHDNHPGVHQGQVTTVKDASGGDIHRLEVVDDIGRPKEGGDRSQPGAAFAPGKPSGVDAATQVESPENQTVFVFPSPVPTSAKTGPIASAESADTPTSSDLPSSAKTLLAKMGASSTSSPEHQNPSSSSNSTPTKTKTVTITRRISEGLILRKLPTQKDILSRYGRVSVGSDLGGSPLREVREAEASHARSSSDIVVTRKISSTSEPALGVASVPPPEVPRPVTSQGFASPKSFSVSDEKNLKTCSTESLISEIEKSHEVLLVQTLLTEVAKLQEQNLKLWKENAKLSTMNKVMVAKYKELKQLLEDSSNGPASELQKFHPEFV